MLDITATVTSSLSPFQSFYFDIVLPEFFLPYPPPKNHAMASEQYQLNIIPHNGMLWVNATAFLYFLHLHRFYILSVFWISLKTPSPHEIHEIIKLITYLWLFGKNIVLVSCMYKNSLRLLGFAALFPYYSNVFLIIVWLNILAKYTSIHAFTTKTNF